jgi:hypothetical protein
METKTLLRLSHAPADIIIDATGIPYFASLIVKSLVQRLGINNAAELIETLAELGIPRTLEEQQELANLATVGTMHTEIYYRWATALRDAESNWSVTKAGADALTDSRS